MIKKYVVLILLFTSCFSFSQSSWKKFKKLSSAKKIWIIFHPFKAKKAQRISKEAYRVADSIKKSPVLDGDGAGGQVDAFRHAFWMASLRQEIGKNAARSLGKAHERENYQTYKKRKRKLSFGIPFAKSSSIICSKKFNDFFSSDIFCWY